MQQNSSELMQFKWMRSRDQYEGSFFSYTLAKYIYNAAYTLYNKKEKNIQEESLRNEVLQPQEIDE